MDPDDSLLIYYDAPGSPTTGLFPRPLPTPPPELHPLPALPLPEENPDLQDLQPIPEDDYNWRKDGKSIFIFSANSCRSYHKCCQFSCPVLKKVDRTLDGKIKEIIYEGFHNHPAPHPGIILSPSMAEETKFSELSGEETGKDKYQFSLETVKSVWADESISTSGDLNVKEEAENEVHICTDGYPWCMCGEKEIKGNDNLSGCYKPTSQDCITNNQTHGSAQETKPEVPSGSCRPRRKLPAPPPVMQSHSVRDVAPPGSSTMGAADSNFRQEIPLSAHTGLPLRRGRSGEKTENSMKD